MDAQGNNHFLTLEGCSVLEYFDKGTNWFIPLHQHHLNHCLIIFHSHVAQPSPWWAGCFKLKKDMTTTSLAYWRGYNTNFYALMYLNDKKEELDALSSKVCEASEGH